MQTLSAKMDKAFTIIKCDERGNGSIESAMTIADAGRLMAQEFGAHNTVSFYTQNSSGIPPVATQIANRLRKLKKIAALAGRVVTRHYVSGNVVTVHVVA